MSRLVLIADSETGRLVDVFGAPRESGRYARFAKRMLSADPNPVLDYGANGGDKLEISAGGTNGAEVDILADVVNIPGELKVSGRTVEEMASEGVEYVLDRIVGTPGEIDVDLTTESSSGETLVQVSLDPAVKSRLSLQQPKIVAVGLLKGEGDGVVSEATVDPAPAIGSTNPVQSGGVHSELSGKLDKSGGIDGGSIQWKDAHTLGGTGFDLFVPGKVTAGNNRIGTGGGHELTIPEKDGTFATTSDLGSFAPLESPAFTGTPTAPTAEAGTNTSQIATTAFVKSAIDGAQPDLDYVMRVDPETGDVYYTTPDD